MRCTHHHIAPYLAKGADQMSVMIVVHLPQRGSHAGHEAPLEKRNKCIQYTIKFKLKAEDRRPSCPWFWWVLTSWADWIWVLKQAWSPGFRKVGALTQWPPYNACQVHKCRLYRAAPLSSPGLHAVHVRSVERGCCHVLCEKFIGIDGLSKRETTGTKEK